MSLNLDIDSLPPEKVEAAISRLEAMKAQRAAENKLAHYRPYPKQAAFHKAGDKHRERLLMCANRFGKTMCGAAELAFHLTGDYPEWWTGKRFDKPVRAWAAGVTAETTRDVLQEKLIGPPFRESEWGTEMIPKAAIAGVATSRGIVAAIDTVSIRHIGGGLSSLQFKSYERGREKWQGAALEVVYFDEEPDEGIYSEGLTRTNETGGIVYLCFTPLLGMSTVVQRFLSSSSAAHPDRAVVTATIDDARHFSAADKVRIVASYMPHELEARTKGVPVLGSGRIFPVKEETLAIEHREFPRHWPRIGGTSVGIIRLRRSSWCGIATPTPSMSPGPIVCARRRRSFMRRRSSRGATCRGLGRVTVAARPWKAPALRWPSSTRRKGSTCCTPTRSSRTSRLASKLALPTC